MGFITIIDHHLGKYCWNLFQASWPCKSKFILGLEMSTGKNCWAPNSITQNWGAISNSPLKLLWKFGNGVQSITSLIL